jgi:ribose transport system substrate-binding protein
MRVNKRWALTASAVLLMAVSACGSSSSGSTASGNSNTPQLNAAKKYLDQFNSTATKLPYTQALKSLPTGKTLYSLDNSSPVSLETAKAIATAGKLLGMKVVTVNQGATPATTKAAWDSVVSAHPDAVIGSGISAEQYKTELAALKAQHVPVVMESVDQPAGYEGIYATTLRPDRFFQWGKMQAAYAAVHSNGTGHLLYMTVPAFAVLLDAKRGWEAGMKEFCPGCKYDEREFTADQLGTTIPGQVVSYVQAHPTTDYVVAGFTDMFLGVQKALDQAGFSKVKGIGSAATPADYSFFDSGFMVTDTGVPVDFKGWYLATLAAYALAGQTVPNPVPDYPTRMLDRATVDALPKGTAWPGVTNFEDQFKKLWGVS